MWTYLVRLILRNRLLNLIIIGLITAFFGYKALDVQLSYELAKMLPAHDTTSIEYENFKKIFGEDGGVFFIAVHDDELFTLKKFNSFYDLTYKIKNIDGVEEIVSITKLYQLVKNDSLKNFDFKKVIEEKPKTQKELDSLKNVIYSLPFYDKLLYNKATNVYLMAITLNKEKLNTKSREYLVHKLKNTVEEFAEDFDIKVHYSGLPYIRTITSENVRRELIFFIIAFHLIHYIFN